MIKAGADVDVLFVATHKASKQSQGEDLETFV